MWIQSHSTLMFEDITLPWRWVKKGGWGWRCLRSLLPVFPSLKCFPSCALTRSRCVKLIRHLHQDWFNVAHFHSRCAEWRKRKRRRKIFAVYSTAHVFITLPSKGFEAWERVIAKGQKNIATERSSAVDMSQRVWTVVFKYHTFMPSLWLHSLNCLSQHDSYSSGLHEINPLFIPLATSFV